MSLIEKHKILNIEFQSLLDDVYIKKNTRVYKAACDCKENYVNNVKKYQNLLSDNTIGLLENPWIFPKGRKQHTESDVDSALREFQEETQIDGISVCDIIDPVEETYYGLDGRLYRTIYFCGFIDYAKYKKCAHKSIKIVTTYRVSLSDEISEIRLFKYEDALRVLTQPKVYILRMINSDLLFKVLERKRIERRHSIG
jgi:8-oxo-dGTP pyrophosphatase MutT (NUDIX family)